MRGGVNIEASSGVRAGRGRVRSAPLADSAAVDQRQARTRHRDAIFRRSLIAADVLAVSASLAVAVELLGDTGLQPLAIVTPLVLVLMAKTMRLYDRDEHRLHKSTLEEVPALLAISAYSALLLLLVGDLLGEGDISPTEVVAVLVMMSVLTVSLRSVARFLARRATTPERCLLVGNSTRQLGLLEALNMSPATHADVVGAVPVGSLVNEGGGPVVPAYLLDELLIDRVVLLPGSQRADELMFAIRELRDAGVKVSVLPDITRLAGSAVEIDHIGGMTLLGMRGFSITRSSQAIKRVFDMACSLLMLVALSPVMAAAAIAIRSDGSGGPVLFRQERIGRGGRRFWMHKFRSMRVGAEDERESLRHLDEGAPGLFKIEDDPRITRVGRFLRRTSIDELPQLLDVLVGHMSLVGPRPLVPEEDEQVVGQYRRRLDVRPGITGHWQILGASRVSLDEMVKLDYLYIANWSVWNDIVLMMRTVPVVIRRRGR